MKAAPPALSGVPVLSPPAISSRGSAPCAPRVGVERARGTAWEGWGGVRAVCPLPQRWIGTPPRGR